MTLRELRELAGLTVENVAADIDVASSTVRNWEKGRTIPHLSVYQASRLCWIYRCGIKDLELATEETKKAVLTD
ncbi:MAG: hypothetical protein NVS2B14_20040 [Chamaesiphon sp.]